MTGDETAPIRRTRSRAAIAMAVFCWATVVFLVARDLGIEEVGNTEVWFGVELRGVWAKRTAPLHWAMYAFAGWAFWRGWGRIWSVSIVYALMIAMSHFLWNVSSEQGQGVWAGFWQFVFFLIPAGVIHWVRPTQTARIGETE